MSAGGSRRRRTRPAGDRCLRSGVHIGQARRGPPRGGPVAPVADPHIRRRTLRSEHLPGALQRRRTRRSSSTPAPVPPKALDRVEAEGRTLEAILLTHAHLDHIDGSGRGQAPHVRTLLPPPRGPGRSSITGKASATMYGLPFETPPPPDHPITPGETLRIGGDEFDVRFAPGHAPGHVIFVAQERARGSFVGGRDLRRIHRPDRPPRWGPEDPDGRRFGARS